MRTLDLNIGADVYCRSEICGKLHKVVVGPESDRITNLIVERGFLQRTDRIVPVVLVADTDDESVSLAINAEELQAYPEYEKVTLGFVKV